MRTTRRSSLFALIAMPAITSCVSKGQQVELAGVASPRQGVRSTAPRTVDLLPIEAQVVVADPGHRLAGGGADMALRAAVISALPPALAARRHRLASVIDRGGRSSGRARQAMTTPEVSAIRQALLRYAQAQLSSPGRLVSPALPHPLGGATRSGATLFVAGYGIAGDDATNLDDLLAALALVQLTVGAVGAVGEVVDDDDDGEGADYGAHISEASAVLDEVAYREQFRAPRSHLRLIVTLVDNASGQVLWHSDRVFARRDPTDPADVRKAVEKSLRRLPRPGAR